MKIETNVLRKLLDNLKICFSSMDKTNVAKHIFIDRQKIEMYNGKFGLSVTNNIIEVDEFCKIIISFELFNNIIQKTKTKYIEFSVEENCINIQAGKLSASIKNDGDLSYYLKNVESDFITLPEKFKEVLKQSYFSISDVTESSLHNLVCKENYVVCSDNKRLTKIDIELPFKNPIYIPKFIIKELLKFDKITQYREDEYIIQVEVDNYIFSFVKPVFIKFPEYQKIINTIDFDDLILIPLSEEVKDSINLSGTFVDSALQEKQYTITIIDDSIIFESERRDGLVQIKDTLQKKIDDPIHIKVNSEFLANAIDLCDSFYISSSFIIFMKESFIHLFQFTNIGEEREEV